MRVDEVYTDKIIIAEETNYYATQYIMESFQKTPPKDASYTTFITWEMPKEYATPWANHVTHPIASTPSLPMELTSTSSMIAPTTDPIVDAPVIKRCRPPDALESLFGLPSLEVDTGSISQYIVKEDRGTLTTVKTQGESGFSTVKLEIFQTKDIEGEQEGLV